MAAAISTSASPSSIAEQQKRLTIALTGNSSSPKLDAAILLCNALNVPRSYLIAHDSVLLSPAQMRRLDKELKRRINGEPIAYITGTQEFWSLSLKVSPDVLVPRPETELLVELILQLSPKPQTVLDLGTGSGAIALALAKELPKARITACDQSEAALAIAEENARTLQLNNLKFLRSDWFSSIAEERFDVCVSNPPYIKENDPHLAGDGVKHEPRMALTAGADGLDCLRSIIKDASSHLNPRGRLLLEHGCDQADPVQDCLFAAGWKDIQSHRDYAGLNRVTSATFPE